MQSQAAHGDMQVYSCRFEFRIAEASITMKFPCSYFVEIKSINNKITLGASRSQANPVNSVIRFDEAISFQTDLLYNVKSKQFLKKEVIVVLNLVSARRPDQVKLVGRVALDLTNIISTQNYSRPKDYTLEYCSLNASVRFEARLLGRKVSLLSVDNFDKDSFSDFQSFVAGIHKDSSKLKNLDEAEKTMEMPWNTKNYDILAEQSPIDRKTQQNGGDRVNSTRISHKVKAEEQIVQPLLLQTGDRIKKSRNEAANAPESSNRPDEKTPAQDCKVLINQQQASPISRSNSASKFTFNSAQHSPSVPNQYQEILRNGHVQERKIWEEEKRLLNQHISRERAEVMRQKERIDTLEKKVYEHELKASSYEAKIENEKRERSLLIREKQLQIKECKAKAERYERERGQNLQVLQLKQTEVSKLKQVWESEVSSKNTQIQALHRDLQSLAKVSGAQLSEISAQSGTIAQLRKQIDQLGTSRNEMMARYQSALGKIQELCAQNERASALRQELDNCRNQKLQVQEKLANLQQQQLLNQRKLEALEGQQSNLKQQYEQLILKSEINFSTQINDLSQAIAAIEASLREKQAVFNSELAQKQMEINDLRIRLGQKDEAITKIINSYDAKLASSQHMQASKVAQDTQIEVLGLRNRIKQLEAEAQQSNILIQSKEENIRVLTLGRSQEAEAKQKQISMHKQYTYGLEEQILQSHSKISALEDTNQKLLKKMQALESSLNEMKVYEKGLEEQILSIHEAKQLEAEQFDKKIAQLVQQNNSKINQLSLLVSSLEQEVQAKDFTLNERNMEIQKLLTTIKQGNERIILLENQLLDVKINLENENALKSSQKVQDRIKLLTEENKKARDQISVLVNANFELKQQKLAKQEEIIQLQQQVETLARMNKHSAGSRDNEGQQQTQKIVQLEQQLLAEKQYREGLEATILEYHGKAETEQPSKQMSCLTLQLDQQVQYTRGLEHKILQDAIIVEELSAKIACLSEMLDKKTIKLESLQDKAKDQKGISQNQRSSNSRQESQQNFTAQEQKPNLPIQLTQPGFGVKSQQQYIKKVEELQSYITSLEEQLNAAANQVEGTPFGAAIRVISVHSPSEEEERARQLEAPEAYDQDGLEALAVKSNRVFKSQISQPPSLMDKDEMKELEEDDMSLRNSPNRMSLTSGEAAKAIKQVIKDSLNSNEALMFQREREIAAAQKSISMLNQEVDRLNQHIKQLEAQAELKEQKSSSADLRRRLQTSQSELQALQERFQAKVEAEGRALIQIQQANQYIKNLETINKQYECRINLLKEKQTKIEQTLCIIEQESLKIAQDLELKQREKDELTFELSKLQEINMQLQLQSVSNSDGHGQSEEVEKLLNHNQLQQAEINRLLVIQKAGREQVSNLFEQLQGKETELAAARAEVAKYEEAITQEKHLQAQQDTKHNEQKVQQLEKQLQQLNEQLMVNKRLLSKFRQTRQSGNVNNENSDLLQQNSRMSKRLEELEEELFNYQATENEKELLIQTLQQELHQAREQAQRIHGPNQVHAREHGSANAEHSEALVAELQKIKSELSVANRQRQALQKSEQILRNELHQRQAQIVQNEKEKAKFEAMIKAQRLEYYNKKRSLIEQNERSLQKIKQIQQQLVAKSHENAELRARIQKIQKKMPDQNAKGINSEGQHRNLGEQISRLKAQMVQLNADSLNKEELLIQKNMRIQELEFHLSSLQQHQQSTDQNETINDMQNQINYYSQELGLASKKYEQLEPQYYQLLQKLEQSQKVVHKLSTQLLALQQMAQSKGGQTSTSLQQNQLAKSEGVVGEEGDSRDKILKLEQRVMSLLEQKERLTEQLQQRQMEHLNTELDLHFKLREKNEKSGAELAKSITDNPFRKSLNASQDVGLGDIVPASRQLKEIVNGRGNRSATERNMEVLVVRVSQLQDQLYNAALLNKQKVLLLEKSRLMSMQFSKFKVNLMKSKLPSEERMRILAQVKPIEATIKQILNLSELCSESMLLSDEVIENSPSPSKS